MSVAGPTKQCPRCNTVLPVTATFCGTCGLQFPASAPPAGNYAPPPFAGSGGPAGYPPPPPAPNYPQPGAPGAYPPPGSVPGGMPGSYPAYGAPVQTPYPPGYGVPPKKGGAGRAIILVLVLVILVGGGAAAWFLFLGPGHTNSPFFDRHGLQSNVPLPNGSNFVFKKTLSESDSGVDITADIWGWTVTGMDPTATQQFYKDNLPKNGWTKVQTQTGSDGEKEVLACQSGQVLVIAAGTKLELTDKDGKVTDTINAPSGGSALATELTSSAVAVQLLCSDTPIFPTPSQ